MLNEKIDLCFSKQASLLFIILLAGAVVGIFLLPVSIYWKLSLGLVVFSWGWQLLRQQAWLQSSQSIIGLIRLQDSQYLLISKTGQQIPGKLLGNSFISPFMMVLNFKLVNSWKIRTVLIMPDSSNFQTLRRFRVLLLSLRVKPHAANS